CARREDSLDVW
nr:immunoglobulin heavy chain junction region [Macaca mulatta]